MIPSCANNIFLSVVQLKGKHSRNPHCRNEVVDTFWHSVIANSIFFYPNVYPKTSFWRFFCKQRATASRQQWVIHCKTQCGVDIFHLNLSYFQKNWYDVFKSPDGVIQPKVIIDNAVSLMEQDTIENVS